MEYIALALNGSGDQPVMFNTLFGTLPDGVYSLGIVSLFLWALVWKGIALWKAARNGQKFWFVVILILNTIGILEIIYLLLFRKKQPQPSIANTPVRQ